MKRFLLLGFGLFFLLSSASPVRAADCPNVNATGLGVTLGSYTDGMTHDLSFNTRYLDKNYKYKVVVTDTKSGLDEASSGQIDLTVNGSGSNNDMSWTVNGETLSVQIKAKDALQSQELVIGDTDAHYVSLWRNSGWFGAMTKLCDAGSYETPVSSLDGCDSITVWQERGGEQCYYPTGCLASGAIKFQVKGLSKAGSPFNGEISVDVVGSSDPVGINPTANVTDGDSEVLTFQSDHTSEYTLKVAERSLGINHWFPGCTTVIKAVDSCPADECGAETTIGLGNLDGGEKPEPFKLCKQIGDPALFDKCMACAGGEVAKGIWTAVGCIPTKAESIVKTFLQIGLSIAGGFALIMIMVAGFILSTSQGDPKRTNEARDMITSAIIGLFFIILSVTIMQFIGVTLFHLPGLGG